MDELEDLDATDKEIELSAYEEIHEEPYFFNELLLHAAIILTGNFENTFLSSTVSSEYKNHFGGKIARWCFTGTDFRRQQEQDRKAWFSDQLPDVCGGCFTSYGLTTAGRYRFTCPSCKGTHLRQAWDRLLELNRSCLSGRINEAAMCQLIYKYHSPNGDKQWQVKQYNLWLF